MPPRIKGSVRMLEKLTSLRDAGPDPIDEKTLGNLNMTRRMLQEALDATRAKNGSKFVSYLLQSVEFIGHAKTNALLTSVVLIVTKALLEAEGETFDDPSSPGPEAQPPTP